MARAFLTALDFDPAHSGTDIDTPTTQGSLPFSDGRTIDDVDLSVKM
jgi:hypothetical protein